MPGHAWRSCGPGADRRGAISHDGEPPAFDATENEHATVRERDRDVARGGPRGEAAGLVAAQEAERGEERPRAADRAGAADGRRGSPRPEIRVQPPAHVC